MKHLSLILIITLSAYVISGQSDEDEDESSDVNAPEEYDFVLVGKY